VDNYQDGIEKGKHNQHDLYFIDFRLPLQNGIELMKELVSAGCDKPIIILTGRGDHDIDVEAMRIGAADYMEKDRLSPEIVERTVRYAIERAENLNRIRASEKKLRMLSRQLLEAQETERKLIAQELHDSISANLTAIKFGLEKKRLDDLKKKPSGTDDLDRLIALVKATVEEVQGICVNLRPAIIDELGIGAALQWLCRQYSQSHEDVSLSCRCRLDEDMVPPSLKIAVFRLLQEALNNALKHSRAARISLRLNQVEDRIVAELEDSGKGFDVASEWQKSSLETGMGLINMKERTELSGGVFKIESTEGKGTKISAEWTIPRR